MSFINMRAVFLFLFGLLTLQALSQNTITGSVHQDYVGKSAYLYLHSDEVSGLKVLADSCTIGQQGTFKLSMKNERIQMVTLAIDRVNADFFVVPNQHYDVYFSQLPTSQAKTFNGTNKIDIIFNTLPEKDINNLVGLFNREFDNFYDYYISDIFDKDFRDKLDTFRSHCDSAYSGYKIPFLNAYINYVFGDFEQRIGSNRKQMFLKYVKPGTYDVHNPEFVRFATSFFGDYIGKYDAYSKNHPLASAISSGNLTDFLAQFSHDDGLKDKQDLREMVVLINLNDEYHKRKAAKQNILKMIRELGTSSTLLSTKELSKNLLTALTQFDSGFPVPNFNLRKSDGGKISLEQLKGKPTLMVFAGGWSRESLGELNLLNELYQKYSKDIYFLLVSLDDKESDYQNLISASGTKIPMRASYLSDKYILERMNILYVPQFVIIDKNGNYFKWFGSDPSHTLDANLTEVLKLN